jgi:hypothetical protein
VPIIDSGASTAGKANVDGSFNIQTVTPGNTAGGVEFGGGPENGQALFSENDSGLKTGARVVLSPETDDDYRLRIANDTLLDSEQFNYTSQNTGKHTHTFTTLTATCSSAGLLLNSGNITTTTTGMTFGTFKEFPILGTQSTFCETALSFSAQPAANVVTDFGLFRRGATAAFAPGDGVYFRVSSTGVQGVVNNNGVETSTSVFPLSGGTGTYAYTNNAVHRYLIQISNVQITFWIDNLLYGAIPAPVGSGFAVKSSTLPWSVRNAIVGGAAGTATQVLISDYRVGIRGAAFAEDLGTTGNRIYGSYEGLSGGTMGSLANYANSANPTAGVPTNTTAALGTGLGGQFWETVSLAATTDGIICSYQVPAGTVAVQGRRLRITGVSLSSYVQTVVVGGPYNAQYSLAFGHTALSLATAETASFATATTKAPRRIALPALTQLLTAAQAVNTMVAQPGGAGITFANPIYVNPGEFVALVTKHVGTAGTTGTVAHVVAFDYSWE